MNKSEILKNLNQSEKYLHKALQKLWPLENEDIVEEALTILPESYISEAITKIIELRAEISKQ